MTIWVCVCVDVYVILQEAQEFLQVRWCPCNHEDPEEKQKKKSYH